MVLWLVTVVKLLIVLYLFKGRDMLLKNIQWYSIRKYKSWEFAEMFHSDLFNYFDCV